MLENEILDEVVFNSCGESQMALVINGQHLKMAAGESDDEAFEDAVDALSLPPDKAVCPSLDESIQAAHKALDLFLSNRFNDALLLMKQWSHVSMYHALGKGTVLFLQAVLTLENGDIEIALEALHQAVAVCNSRRKRTAFTYVTRLIRGVDYNSYTEDEVHAELCYAECLLEIALISFISDQSLVSFVRGGLRIRSCYQSYKECMQILEMRNWENKKRKCHFESGVRMGVGAFNLMISQLPSRVLKLLEFIGFSGNRTLGLKELDQGFDVTEGLRSPLCALILLSFHTYVSYIIGNGDGDIDRSEVVLYKMLEKYPQGALFLFLHGRIKTIRGKIDEAIHFLQESINAQSEWRQFHYLCHWELQWCYSFKCEWANAMKSASILRKECRWSPAVYTYIYASLLYMQYLEGKTEYMDEIEELYSKVPGLKQRLAGKSLPSEKFAVRKSNKFFAQGKRLLIPQVELIYVWNGFPMIGRAPKLVKNILKLIDSAMPTEGCEVNEDAVEDYCLALLLRGLCLKHSDNLTKAKECFQKIISLEKMITDDVYLVPFAMAEMGHIAYTENNLVEARELLENARHNYHAYPMETILHFRVHSAIRHLKGKGDSSPSTPIHSADPFAPLKVEDENSSSKFQTNGCE